MFRPVWWTWICIILSWYGNAIDSWSLKLTWHVPHTFNFGCNCCPVPSPPVDSIWAVMLVWRLRGNMVRTAPCCVVYGSCIQWWAHLDEQFLQFSLRGNMVRTAPCCVVYGSCIQWWAHLDEQFLQFSGLYFVILGYVRRFFVFVCMYTALGCTSLLWAWWVDLMGLKPSP